MHNKGENKTVKSPDPGSHKREAHWLKPPLQDQLRPPLDTPLGVHLQQPRRRSPSRGQPANSEAIQNKVFAPQIASRVKKRYDVTRVRIDCGEIGPFVSIAPMASPRQVFQSGQASVLASHDMFEVKRLKRWPAVWQPAVFTTPVSLFVHHLPQGFAH